VVLSPLFWSAYDSLKGAEGRIQLVEKHLLKVLPGEPPQAFLRDLQHAKRGVLAQCFSNRDRAPGHLFREGS
jgi:hypothetical protein